MNDNGSVGGQDKAGLDHGTLWRHFATLASSTPRLPSCPRYHVRQRTAYTTSAMADSEFMVTTARPLDDVGFRTHLDGR